MSSAVAAPSVASDRSAIQPSQNAARPDATIAAARPSAIRERGPARRMLGWLEEAALLLLLGLAFPLAILVVGSPIALVVRLLIEIGRRWY
jgi:hypothetical protein